MGPAGRRQSRHVRGVEGRGRGVWTHEVLNGRICTLVLTLADVARTVKFECAPTWRWGWLRPPMQSEGLLRTPVEGWIARWGVSMKIRRVRGLLLVAVVGAGLLASTAFVPGAQSATAESPRYSIDFAPCPGSTVAQCGTLRVPADWSHPKGPKINVAVARRPADDPAHRIGTLFYNPGGPGDGAVRYVIEADTFFSATLRARFDIVGLDPRGVGASTPIRCGVPALTPDYTFFPRTQREFDAMVAHNRALAKSCLQQTGPLFLHADTVSVARDHEAVRIALGVSKVNWLGLSYGTQVGAQYAAVVPEAHAGHGPGRGPRPQQPGSAADRRCDQAPWRRRSTGSSNGVRPPTTAYCGARMSLPSTTNSSRAPTRIRSPSREPCAP